jgi:hypothetical protein
MINSDKFWRFQNMYCSLIQIHGFVIFCKAQNTQSFVLLFFFRVVEYNIIYLKNFRSNFFETMKCHF